MGDKVPKVVEAQRFVLRDASGTVRAELSAVEGEAGLVVLSPSGKFRAELTAVEDGAGLVIFGPRGEVRVAVGVDADGEPSLNLCDGDPASRAGLTRLTDGAWAVCLSGPGGQGRVMLTVEPDGAAAVYLNDQDRKARASLVVDSDGTPSLCLWDREGNPRTTMQLRRDGTPAFALYDKYGRPTWSRPRSTEHVTTPEKLRKGAPRSRAEELGQLTYDWWLHRKAKKG